MNVQIINRVWIQGLPRGLQERDLADESIRKSRVYANVRRSTTPFFRTSVETIKGKRMLDID